MLKKRKGNAADTVKNTEQRKLTAKRWRIYRKREYVNTVVSVRSNNNINAKSTVTAVVDEGSSFAEVTVKDNKKCKNYCTVLNVNIVYTFVVEC